ncbi:MAG TPA: Rne/Rng family ribonuclease [Micropepsaceae bacterium]|nr:Rne/Rng family ribonuclease [Micropepsaceae bacterium]
MTSEVLINVGPGETRVAVMEDGRLDEYFVERVPALGEDETRRGRSGHSILGNIILGRVQRVLPAMDAAFVEIGQERAGFLSAREARCLAEMSELNGEAMPPIGLCVKEGDAVLVQVIKDPIGDKGARLSANVTVPGRLLVLVPQQKGLALSRRIEDEAERERLSALMARVAEDPDAMRGAGYIVRTVAIGTGFDELRDDAAAISAEWRKIEAARQSARAPATVWHDLDPVARTLRDNVKADTARVLIDCPEAHAEALAYARRAMPHMAAGISLHNGHETLFDAYGIEDEVDRLLDMRVDLCCGGWITIETTEALTAIDVNSGSLTGANCLEETGYRTNLDAAAEIGRQVRLRGIGGLIVADFIHMGDPENIASVLQTLALSLGRDRVPTQILGFSEFGLVEMTRKRTREPLAKFLTEPYRGCLMGGRVKTIVTVANEVMRRIEREARCQPGRSLLVQTSPDVARWLKAQEEGAMRRLRARIGNPLKLEARENYGRMRFDVTPVDLQ